MQNSEQFITDAVNAYKHQTYENVQGDTEGVNLEEFTQHAKEQYDLPESASLLIFSRKNTQENGEFDTGSLNEAQFGKANENLMAFNDIRQKYDLTNVDSDAAMLLTGDNDGKLSTDQVDTLISQGALEVTEQGNLQLTKDGKAFFESLNITGPVDIIGSNDIMDLYSSYKSGDQESYQGIVVEDAAGMQEAADGAAYYSSTPATDVPGMQDAADGASYTAEPQGWGPTFIDAENVESMN